jgi:hypothetical protein
MDCRMTLSATEYAGVATGLHFSERTQTGRTKRGARPTIIRPVSLGPLNGSDA